jgi:peptidoglycan/xylan/chitin deacetylase (PgdA/CDA1 family)
VSNGAATVALTFDDGPGQSTAAILKILLAYHVRATFFNIGASESYRSSDVVAEAMDGFDVSDHTWSHPVMTTLSTADQRAQMAAAATEQRSLVGSSPCGFRPPDGDYDAVTTSVASSLAMSEWMWNVDTQDWRAEGSDSSYWVQRIISLAESEGGAQRHPIVLMHNQSIAMPATVAALPTIIRYFEARHYQFVDLLGRSGPPNSCGSSLEPFATTPRHYLGSGQFLSPGSTLSSPNGQFALTQERNGVLALTGDGRLMWHSPGGAHPGAVTRLDARGALTLTTGRGAVLWHSATSHAGDRLSLGDDGELSLSSDGRTWWSTQTHLVTLGEHHVLRPGWTLYSTSGQCRLVMARTGQLILQSASYGTLWSSRGALVAGSSAVFELNGSLVVTSPSQRVLWASGSLGAASSLQVTNAGRVVVRSSSDHWFWSNP